MGNQQITASTSAQVQIPEEKSKPISFELFDYNREGLIEICDKDENLKSTDSSDEFCFELHLPYAIKGTTIWYVFLSKNRLQLSNDPVFLEGISGSHVKWELDPHPIPQHYLRNVLRSSGEVLGSIVVDSLCKRLIFYHDIKSDNLAVYEPKWVRACFDGLSTKNAIFRMVLREYNVLWVKKDRRSNHIINILTTTLRKRRAEENSLYPNLAPYFELPHSPRTIGSLDQDSPRTIGSLDQDSPRTIGSLDRILLRVRLELPVPVGGSNVWYLCIYYYFCEKTKLLQRFFMTSSKYVFAMHPLESSSDKQAGYMPVVDLSYKIEDRLCKEFSTEENEKYSCKAKTFTPGQIISVLLIDAMSIRVILYYDDNDVNLHMSFWYEDSPYGDLPHTMMKEILQKHIDAEHDIIWLKSKKIKHFLRLTPKQTTIAKDLYIPSDREHAYDLTAKEKLEFPMPTNIIEIKVENSDFAPKN
jgi:hypothetical protein